MDNILQEYQPSISAITEIELLCWKTASESDLSILKDFIEDSGIDTEEREGLCDALYKMGDALGLDSETEYIDKWRDW